MNRLSHYIIKRRIKSRLHPQSQDAFHIHNSMRFEAREGSSIILNGDLELACSWSQKAVLPFLLKLGEGATLRVNGRFRLYEGSMIYVNKNATLSLGSGYINNRLQLSCFQKIEIGQQVVISEGVTIRDSDNHTILGGFNKSAPITICDRVWIGINVTILKGVTIGSGAVVGAGAVVTKDVPEGCLAAGVPARVIKENISWE
jgi:acetyltransferase-like isoleucine patch superfamily enzyme